ncbi:MAG: hypothetical protein HYY86_00095 [Candidatus Harrisonbacteria bacterium]|nr:hypothetical protein [Candidatus Harrisonbacteria bacterium]
MLKKVFTRGDLLNLLEKEAEKYRLQALASIERNRHMNDLSVEDLAQLKKNQQLTQRVINALLVDFINVVGTSQCCDYGLNTKQLESKAKWVQHHDDRPCTARLTTQDGGRWCPKCKLHPDMQSTCLYPYCPSCDRSLKNMKCPKCGQIFQRPSS